MASSVFVAYDASINAEWVTRYASRLAARTPDRVLHLLTVEDGAVGARDLSERLDRLRRTCDEAGAILETTVVPRNGEDVVDALTSAVPPGRQSLLCCGTRARDAGRGLLRDSVSARLLGRQHCDVLAIRVVSPGLLGVPRRILYALSQNPHGVERALPFLELLVPGVDELALLTIMEVGTAGFHSPTTVTRPELLGRGRAFVEAAAETIRSRLEPPLPRIDPHTSVSDDIPETIVRHAGRVHAQLVLVGATERSLPRRLVFGSPLERVLEASPCDVAVFRAAADG